MNFAIWLTVRLRLYVSAKNDWPSSGLIRIIQNVNITLLDFRHRRNLDVGSQMKIDNSVCILLSQIWLLK